MINLRSGLSRVTSLEPANLSKQPSQCQGHVEKRISAFGAQVRCSSASHPQHFMSEVDVGLSQFRQRGSCSVSGLKAGSILAYSCCIAGIDGTGLVRTRSGHISKA